MEPVERNYRHHALTFALIVIIILILLYDIIAFISGPMVINQHRDEIAQSKMMERNKRSGCQLVNRFAEDKVIYISECQGQFIFYLEDGTFVLKEDVVPFSQDFIEENVENFEVSIGYLNNHAVYVLNSEDREICLDYRTHNVVRDYWKGR